MNHNNLHSTLQKITFNKQNRLQLFLDLDPADRPYVMSKLSKHAQRDLAVKLPEKTLIGILEEIDPDKTTDIVQLLAKNKQTRIINKINKSLRGKILLLNRFDPKTAAGIMNLDYILVDQDDNIGQIIKQCKEHEKNTGKHPVIVARDSERIYGYLPGYALGYAKPKDTAKPYLRKIITIRHDASYNEVADVFRLHPHNKIAVLGDGGGVIGIIYSDDVLNALNEEKIISLYRFAGVKNEEHVADSVIRKIQSRYRWLIVNIGMSFVIALTVSLFEDVIAKYVLLAVYMPIVAGMGGNVGTQTLAVLVRGIALKQIDLEHAKPAIRREVLAGIGNGTIIGALVAAIVLIVNGNLPIAAILGLSMVAIFCFATFFGAVTPLILHKFGKDPATSAMVFITTATDVLGFFVFLGLATIILT